MRLIDANALKDVEYINKGNFNTVEGIREWIDNAPTVEYPFYQEAYQTGYEEEQNKLIKLFNKYDILLVHMDGKIVPVKNSTKQECYNLLYEIQELIKWRKGKV